MTTLTEAADRLNRAAIGLKKLRKIDAIASKHRLKISAFFRKQKTLTLEKFAGYKFLFTEEYRTLREEVRPNELLTTHDWDRLWQDIDRETFDQLQSIIAGVEADGVLEGGRLLQKTINPTGKFWDLSNPRAVQWFQRYGGSVQYIRGINETTRDLIQTVVTKAIDTGQSYTQTAKEIADTFDGMSIDRAQRIAIHEATQAYENGNLMFAQGIEDDGVEMEKAWNTSRDEKVCDTCNENEAVGYIPLDDVFPSGHLIPPAHNGDRCYATYRAVAKS